MRPVNIHAMLLKTAIEEVYEEPQRDLAQPEIVRREDRQRLEPPTITEAWDQYRAKTLIPRVNIFATIENDLQMQKGSQSPTIALKKTNSK